MERIVFLERNTFTIDFPRPAFKHNWIEYGKTPPAEIVPRLREATIAIVNKLPLVESDLSRLPGLKLIAVAATGVDNIDLQFCRTHNISVCNTRGYAVRSLPEHVLMLILALRRNLIDYKRAVDHGQWQEARQFCLLDYEINDVHDSTLGIIGYGSLGQAVARLATAFGMKVILSERKEADSVRPGRKSLAETLMLSDVVTLHCPLTEATKGLVGANELSLMKPSSLLINTARGGLVDEEALVQALRKGIIAGAGIDVLSNEPPKAGSLLLHHDIQI